MASPAGGISATGMQAGAARLRRNGTAGGNGVTDILAAVEATSRSAMADLRRLLALLRDRVQAVVYAHRYGLHSNFTN